MFKKLIKSNIIRKCTEAKSLNWWYLQHLNTITRGTFSWIYSSNKLNINTKKNLGLKLTLQISRQLDKSMHKEVTMMFKKPFSDQNVFGKGCIILFIILITLISSACSSQSSNQLHENEPLDDEKQPSLWGELFSFSGTIDQVQPPKYELNPSIVIQQLSELTGLAERTDIVFQPVMSNNYLYEKPGEVLEFKVFKNQHVHIHYRLAEVNKELAVVNTVFEHTTSETDFAINLPNQENVLYLLSLEAMNEQNETIDTALYVIEVVPQVINAELTLDQTIFQADQAISATLNLMNYGPNVLYYGGNYSVEQYENGSWYSVSLKEPLNFNTRLYNSQPGEVFSQRFGVASQLSEGKYRVVKAIEARGVSTRLDRFEGVHLAVEFEVVGTD